MGRLILGDEILQDKLTALAKAGRFQIGLLIGQNTADTHIIVHLAPTPVPDEGDLSSEDEDPTLPDPTSATRPDPTSATRPDPTSSKYPDSIPKVVDATVTEHARQAVRMLPGGLNLLGVYIVTTPTDFTAPPSQAKIRGVLSSIHRTTTRVLLESCDVCTEKVVIHVCSQTFKITCKTEDLSTTTSEASSKVSEVKFTRGGSGGDSTFKQLSYCYNINLNFWLPKEQQSAQSLYRTLLTLLRPWAKSVKESLILIDSALPDDSDTLDPPRSKTKGGGGPQTPAPTSSAPHKVFTAEILDACTPLVPPSAVGGGAEGAGCVRESMGCVKLTGSLAGLAFVHSKATVGESRGAVIMDLVRSVVGRWEMHCDSLVEEPLTHLQGPIIHEPPRRVFIDGGGLPVSLCDYLFPGDTPTDACQSAKELLGLRIQQQHVDDTLETLADASDVENIGEPGEPCEPLVNPGLGRRGGGGVRAGGGSIGGVTVTHLLALLAILTVMIAIGVSYFK
ncbi:hypothetical protein Pmani_035517 [Petrolisthes manimaculis]|uniref:Protein odr-4 homolog n=1 Tax=Petrolisthes manimaculis TaxID=1843537 RepID=A0AAE1NM87_9EUCA|nr:hypothetical protein Pmani_035517 [Petrolisthes manimaculis]